MSLHITVCTTAVDNSSSEQQKGSAPPPSRSANAYWTDSRKLN